MKYVDYMNTFTVDGETKEILSLKMKQHAKQLGARKTDKPTESVPAAPRRKNTFKLHPKRWIAIAVSIVLLLVATPIVIFTALRGGEKEGMSITMEFMKDMMVEVDGVTAYSIRRETVDGTVAPVSLGMHSESKSPALSLLPATLVEDESDIQPLADTQKSYNYLYSTTEDYELGNVEYDEKGIQRVTFKKNTSVTEDVYDQNGNLITSDRKIMQEELDAQVNRMYTTKNFTFIQFVPKVEESGFYRYRAADGKTGGEYIEIRPNYLIYNEYGVADFDERRSSGHIVSDDGIITEWYGQYYTSYLVASFIIDNRTGYIYPIENFVISEIMSDGVVWGTQRDLFTDTSVITSGIWKIETDENHDLVFTDMMPNKDVEVQDVTTDSYGWTYVWNKSIDDVDAEKKIIYTTKGNDGYGGGSLYVRDEVGDVYVMGKDRLTHKIVEGVAVPFENQGIVRGLRSVADRYANVFYGMYNNLVLYYTRTTYISTDEGGQYAFMIAVDPDTENGLYLEYNDGISFRWLDSNYDTLIVEKGGKLYYKSVNLSDYLEGKTVLTVADFTMLSDYKLETVEDYYLPVGNDSYLINEVYLYRGLNETKYFHIVKTTTGLELVELTSKSYEDNIFIFQPINK